MRDDLTCMSCVEGFWMGARQNPAIPVYVNIDPLHDPRGFCERCLADMAAMPVDYVHTDTLDFARTAVKLDDGVYAVTYHPRCTRGYASAPCGPKFHGLYVKGGIDGL